MIVYYFGADSPWVDGAETSIRRRNMAILWAISNRTKVKKVYNVVRCSRYTLWRNYFVKQSSTSKVANVYLAPIFPERGVLKRIFGSFNRNLLKILYRGVFSNDEASISWCYWPKGFEDFEFLKLENKLIFDTDHNIIHDPNLSLKQRKIREHQLLQIGKKAEVVLSSSRTMLRWYETNGFTNTALLMNGVFENRINLNNNKNKEKKSYQVTYCGTLSKWMNIDWLRKIIEEQSHWQFNFVGANYKTDIASTLALYQNVKLHGFLPPRQVDRVISESDVCFGLYQDDDALDVNSMKLYDYLAQGVSVVVNEYHRNLQKDFDGLLNVASNYEEFKNLLAQPQKHSIASIQEFLLKSSWSQRITQIFYDIDA